MSIFDRHGARHRSKTGINWTVRYISKRYCEPDDHRSKEIYTYQLTSEHGEIKIIDSLSHPWLQFLEHLKESDFNLMS